MCEGGNELLSTSSARRNSSVLNVLPDGVAV
ncbi:hypothetical protein F443_11145 [Phytophthora nicotianae P1569]|uniref:Uncharacterized protein n=1 Tax=Phytophthora nicotianae P1569 TaxID=1317065 RepID=V9EXW1_PHYNI|nr:hypothetical protein F443_11145 [Phytophthora nicotianae P1569]